MLERHTPSPYRWVILLVNCLLMASVYLSLSSWSVAVPELKKDFGLDSMAVMEGTALLIAGYSIGNFFEARLLASWGWRKVLAWTILAFVIASVAIPFVPSYAVILFLRFVQGWGLVVTIIATMNGAWFPTNERGLANGVLIGFIPGGVAVGGVLSGMLVPLVGWKATFLILAAIVVVCVALYYLLIRDAPMMPAQQVSTVAEIATAERPSLFRSPPIWLCGLAIFSNFFQIYGMYAFLGDYLYSIGLATGAVGILILINGLIGVISTPVAGVISDLIVSATGDPLRGRAYSMALVGFLVAVIGSVLVPHLAPLGFGMATLAVILAGWGIPATNGPLVSLPIDLYGPWVGGEAIGVILLLGGAGGVIAPILVTWIASIYGWYVGWYLTGAGAALGLVAGWFLPSARARATKKLAM